MDCPHVKELILRCKHTALTLTRVYSTSGGILRLNIDSLLLDDLLQYIVCPVNEYVGGSPETCQPCPAMSSSPGGVVRVCPCMDGYGRVNDLVPSLPCVGESTRVYKTFYNVLVQYHENVEWVIIKIIILQLILASTLYKPCQRLSPDTRTLTLPHSLSRASPQSKADKPCPSQCGSTVGPTNNPRHVVLHVPH